MLKNITGVDHAVIAVPDLDAAAENWRSLGFITSPRGTHSAVMGTGNYTIMLGEDYIELIGVLNETPMNAPTRDFLARTGGGVERVAFTTPDAAAGAEEIRARGFAAIGPNDFERPVLLPNGETSAAKFSTFLWPVEMAPGGIRIFACQHKTRDTVWIPELQRHGNTAKRILRVIAVSSEPEKAAEHLALMIDGEVRPLHDRTMLVASGPGRADFVFVTRELLGRHYPGVPLESLPDRGGVGLLLAASDLGAVRQWAGNRGIDSHGAVVVPAANNIMLAFVQR